MSLKRNVAASFIGQGWVVLMSFAFIPLYIRYLGIEAYGLIGFFIGLQAWIVVLDLGLGMTLTREMARFSARQVDAPAIRDLLASAQWLYAVLGAVIGLAIWFLAPYLASNWFSSATLSHDTIVDSLRLLGLSIVIRWAAQLYRASIQGLQRQVWLAAFTVAASTLRAVGAVLLLVLGSASVVQFFAWQLAVSVLELAVLGVRLHGYLPGGARVAGSAAPLFKVWRFAGGVFLTNMFAVMMTQTDKLILAKMLPLGEFGYYTFAFTLGTAFAMFATPVFQAVAPRLTADIASGDSARVAATYHKASQTMATIALPAAAVAIFHAHTLIYVWSGDSLLAERSAGLTAVFVAAYTLNALIHVPAALALSHGWSAWAMFTNMVAALLIVPAVIVAAQAYGAIGAAVANLALNLLYFTIAVRLLHRRLLGAEWRSWFVSDNLVPMVLALAIAAALGVVSPGAAGRGSGASFLVAAWAVVSIAVALSLSYPRAILRQWLVAARRSIATRPDGAP